MCAAPFIAVIDEGMGTGAMNRQALGQVSRHWGPLVALCLLAGSRWLLEGAHPEMQTTDLTEVVGCLMAAGCAALLERRRGGGGRIIGASAETRLRGSLNGLWLCAAGGALAICGSALGARLSDRNVRADDATLALALTPCAIALFIQVLGDEVREDFTARLWPGLAGIAGLLLLLPQPVLSGWRFPLALLLMPLLTSLGAVLALTPTRPDNGFRRLDSRFSLSGALLFAAFLFTLLAVVRRHANYGVASQFSTTAATMDGMLALLSLTALRSLGATRWAVQFLLAPLLTLGEGVVLLRPVLDVRSWVAFALLAVGSVYLLFVGTPKAPEPFRLAA